MTWSGVANDRFVGEFAADRTALEPAALDQFMRVADRVLNGKFRQNQQ